MERVALIDYGSGNLRSAEKALARAAADKGHEVVVSADPEVVSKADRLVLPGVGAFAACMGLLNGKDGLVEAMTEAVKTRGAPFVRLSRSTPRPKAMPPPPRAFCRSHPCRRSP